MILYKAWREGRARFLFSAATLGVFCACFVWYAAALQSLSVHAGSYNAYIWKTIYKGYLRELYIVLVLFLGAGGLLREADAGTVTMTLAFPVGRSRHLVDRAVVGIIEVAALAAIPALIVPILSRWRSESYAWSHACKFAVLWVLCGTVIFAMSFLASAIFAGEYTAPVVSLLALIVYSVLADIPAVERRVADLHDVMSGDGMPYFNASTFVPTGPMPWSTLSTIALTTMALFGLSVLLIRQRDF